MITFFHRARFSEQLPWLEAMADGMRAHDESVRFSTDLNGPVDCDLAVMWSHKRDHVIAQCMATDTPYLVMERGYLGDRWENTSAGYGGLNGRADFRNDDVPSDRGDRFRHLLQPERSEGYTLIMGQVPGDKAVEGLDVRAWAEQTAQDAMAVRAAPVKFRQHPMGGVKVDLETTTGTLDEDLAGAGWVITYNSNSGVDAVLSGVPTVALDRGSMARGPAASVMDYRPLSDRDEWLNRLAYCQWTIDEMRSGQAWEHLR